VRKNKLREWRSPVRWPVRRSPGRKPHATRRSSATSQRSNRTIRVIAAPARNSKNATVPRRSQVRSGRLEFHLQAASWSSGRPFLSVRKNPVTAFPVLTFLIRVRSGRPLTQGGSDLCQCKFPRRRSFFLRKIFFRRKNEMKRPLVITILLISAFVGSLLVI